MYQRHGCNCAKPTDEYHGWECEVTGGACEFLYPNAKLCAEMFGEGPLSDVSDEIVSDEIVMDENLAMKVVRAISD